MHISHEEARRLIQSSSDKMLMADQENHLQLHLESCMECREYATSMKSMESLLKPLMQKKICNSSPTDTAKTVTTTFTPWVSPTTTTPGG